MSHFILTCVLVCVFLVCATVCLFIYFNSRNELFGTGRQQCLLFGTLFIVGAAIFAGTFFSYYTHCPNPKCNEWVKSSYCQKCGWEVNVTIDCPTCEKEFNVSKAPAFCPDCGTKVKE